MKKLLLVTLMSSFFLVACGGDGGNSNAVTPPVTNEDGESDTNTTPDEDKTDNGSDNTGNEVEETELPYELTQDKYNELLDAYKLPDQPVYANGKKVDPENIIDVNSNDIEDGWEREIVFKYHEDLVKVNLYMSNAHAETKLTKLYIEGDSSQFQELFNEANLSFSCLAYLKGEIDSDINLFMVKDLENKNFILKRDSAITKVVGGGMDFGIYPEECDKYKDGDLWKQ